MSNAVQVKYSNPLKYVEVKAEKFRPLGANVLLIWEEAHDHLKAGDFILVRPDTHKGQHYTGKILKVGPTVTDELNEGDRVLFGQFTGFEKLFDEKYGRLALVHEANIEAIIPERAEIGGGEPDFNYDA